MQHFICTGRLCDNPSITQGQKSKRAYFQIAISRDIRKEGAPDADFLNCVAFKDRADFVEKYLRKGMKIEVMGRKIGRASLGKECLRLCRSRWSPYH